MQIYKLMLHGKGILVNLVTSICEALKVLQQFELVHGELTPENILVEFNDYNSILENIRIIDFGSSFHHSQLGRISSFTPEYMPPEINECMDDGSLLDQANIEDLIENSYPWSIDVWSLGIMLLEIVSGFPIWMPSECCARLAGGCSQGGAGLLGLDRAKRSFGRIAELQRQISRDLPSTLEQHSLYDIAKDPQFEDLLQQLLHPDPKKRPSPFAILQHGFCRF